MPKAIKSVSDLTPDMANANRHTERGMGMMEKSITECGYGDSVTVDKNGAVISGNGRVETLAAVGMMDAIVVQSDGTRPIIHQRTDLDLEKDVKAKRLALLQNRVGQVNLEWDEGVLARLMAEDVPMDDLFRDDELSKLIADFTPASIDEQGRLDEKTPVTCPECGHSFTP
ncbi:MAG: hypothetical protein ACR2HJ_01685 [Fimbriimonadales bacterium]